MIRRLALTFAACCLIAVATPRVGVAATPLPSLAGVFHLDIDLNVAGTLVELPPRLGATADNPADSGGQSSVDALRNTLRRLEIRRNMLVVHQVMQWTSLSTMFATQVVGMVNRVSLQTGLPRRGSLGPSLGVHRALAATAMGTYYGGAMLAWLAPGPGGTRSIDDKGFSKWRSTRDVHIALSIAHNITMALTIITGVLQANVLGAKDWQGLVTVHTLSAFTTVGLMIPAAIVISRF